MFAFFTKTAIFNFLELLDIFHCFYMSHLPNIHQQVVLIQMLVFQIKIIIHSQAKAIAGKSQLFGCMVLDFSLQVKLRTEMRIGNIFDLFSQ